MTVRTPQALGLDGGGRLAAVELRGVHYGYDDVDGRRPILNQFSAVIPHQRLTVVTGESGIGKSTLLNLIGGLDAPASGLILVHGVPVPYDDNDALLRFRAKTIAWVFQRDNLIGHLDVTENIALPLICAGRPRKEALEIATDAAMRLGLGHRLKALPRALSGGEQARVACARAMVSTGDLILADEPTGNLDGQSAERVYDELNRLVKEAGKTVLCVSHSPRAVERADDAFELTSRGLRRLERTPIPFGRPRLKLSESVQRVVAEGLITMGSPGLLGIPERKHQEEFWALPVRRVTASPRRKQQKGERNGRIRSRRKRH